MQSSISVLVIFGIIAVSSAAQNYIEIYSGLNQTGDGIILRNKIPTLGDWEFMINKGKSYCLVGWWKTYSAEEYQGISKNFFIYATRRCGDSEFGSGVKSLRYLGPADFTTSSISLYGGIVDDDFGGKEIIINAPAATNFEFIVTGILLTGSSDWTTFTNSDFTGNTTCYVHDTDYFNDFQISVPIQSLVKGCDSHHIDRYVYPSYKH